MCNKFHFVTKMTMTKNRPAAITCKEQNRGAKITPPGVSMVEATLPMSSAHIRSEMHLGNKLTVIENHSHCASPATAMCSSLYLPWYVILRAILIFAMHFYFQIQPFPICLQSQIFNPTHKKYHFNCYFANNLRKS